WSRRTRRRAPPHTRIQTRLRSSGWTPPQPRTGLVAPVTGLDALVVAAPIDIGIHLILRTGPRRPVRTTPTIAGGVDEHADPLVKTQPDQLLTQILGKGELIDVLVPVHPL